MDLWHPKGRRLNTEIRSKGDIGMVTAPARGAVIVILLGLLLFSACGQHTAAIPAPNEAASPSPTPALMTDKDFLTQLHATNWGTSADAGALVVRHQICDHVAQGTTLDEELTLQRSLFGSNP